MDAVTPVASVDQRRDWRRPAVYGALGCAFALILFLKLSGFEGVDVARRGEVWTYRLSWLWLPIVATPSALMAVCAVAGLTLPSAASKTIGGIFLFFAVMIAVLAIPGLRTAGLAVTRGGFSHVAGGWWAPERKTVRFADLTSIAVVPPKDGNARLFVLECRRRDGVVVAIPNSTVLEGGLRNILTQAALAGVKVDAGRFKDGD
jgi:hypothetical protein